LTDGKCIFFDDGVEVLSLNQKGDGLRLHEMPKVRMKEPLTGPIPTKEMKLRERFDKDNGIA
jgi:hypothetical protein